MKNLFKISLILTLVVFNAPFILAEEVQKPEDVAVIADFDNPQPTNNVGQEIEIWLREDGSDKTQGCKMSFVEDDALGKTDGHSLRLDYDVDSPNPAYNGLRMGLNHFNATSFKTLNFYLKGDAQQGFTQQLKVELIGPDKRPSPHMVNDITTEWKKFSIPLDEFLTIRDPSDLEKFTVVFADINNDPRVGTVYIDQVYFSK